MSGLLLQFAMLPENVAIMRAKGVAIEDLAWFTGHWHELDDRELFYLYKVASQFYQGRIKAIGLLDRVRRVRGLDEAGFELVRGLCE